MTIKTAFIFDPSPAYMDQTLEEEARFAIMELEGIFNLRGRQHLDIEVAFVGEYVSKEFSQGRYDLVIIDYGGMSSMGASGTAASQIDAVCRYAQEHPSCLVVIWTGYTAEVYEDEVEEHFSGVDNIVARYKAFQVFGNLDGRPEFIEKLTHWFSAEIEKAKAQDPRMGDFKLNTPTGVVEL